MSSLTSVGLRKRVSELWFLWLGEASTISDILQSFYIKGIGVDEHHFLKNWSHLDLKLKKYAEVAENSLMPYPCSHFYFDIKFGAKIDIKVKVSTWIGH